MLRVFVYGTLKPGYDNYQRYCAGQVLGAIPALTQGQIYHLSLGYPGLTPGDRWIKGYLLILRSEAVLAELDRLEGYYPTRSPLENDYTRELTAVFHRDHQPLGTAWVYRMTIARVHAYNGQFLANDEWPGE